MVSIRNTSLLIVSIAISSPSSWLSKKKTTPFFCNAASFDEPHTHNGKVTPFQPGDPKVSLNGKAKAILDNGKPYQTQIKAGSTGGRGLVVQDINAPPSIVWSRILDYDSYASMVPKTVASSNYRIVENDRPNKKRPYTREIYTRMVVGFPVLKLEFFIHHLYFPDLNSLTWTLDYEKLSDFDDSCGYWYVVPHPEKPNWTRVFYSVEVSMYDWVPKFVTDFMSSKALTDATAWLKKYSELEASKLPSTSSSDKNGESDRKETGQTGDKGGVGKIFKNLLFHDVYNVMSEGGNRADRSGDKGDGTKKSSGSDDEDIVWVYLSWTQLILIQVFMGFVVHKIIAFLNE